MLSKILGGLVGILAIVASLLKSRNSDLKREAVEQELNDEKAARELSNQATDALIRGATNEQTTTNPRSHKFNE